MADSSDFFERQRKQYQQQKDALAARTATKPAADAGAADFNYLDRPNTKVRAPTLKDIKPIKPAAAAGGKSPYTQKRLVIKEEKVERKKQESFLSNLRNSIIDHIDKENQKFAHQRKLQAELRKRRLVAAFIGYRATNFVYGVKREYRRISGSSIQKPVNALSRAKTYGGKDDDGTGIVIDAVTALDRKLTNEISGVRSEMYRALDTFDKKLKVQDDSIKSGNKVLEDVALSQKEIQTYLNRLANKKDGKNADKFSDPDGKFKDRQSQLSSGPKQPEQSSGLSTAALLSGAAAGGAGLAAVLRSSGVVLKRALSIIPHPAAKAALLALLAYEGYSMVKGSSDKKENGPKQKNDDDYLFDGYSYKILTSSDIDIESRTDITLTAARTITLKSKDIILDGNIITDRVAEKQSGSQKKNPALRQRSSVNSNAPGSDFDNLDMMREQSLNSTMGDIAGIGGNRGSSYSGSLSSSGGSSSSGRSSSSGGGGSSSYSASTPQNNMTGGTVDPGGQSTGTWRKQTTLPVDDRPASVRYNNPGAAYPSKHDEHFGLEGYGIIGGGHKIGKFPTPVHGQAANFALWQRGYKGLTLQQAVNKWRGGNGSLNVPKGFDPVQRLTPEMLSDKKFMTSFFAGMSEHEAGKGRQTKLTEDQYNQAFDWYQAGGIENAKKLGVAGTATGVNVTEKSSLTQSQSMPTGKNAPWTDLNKPPTRQDVDAAMASGTKYFDYDPKQQGASAISQYIAERGGVSVGYSEGGGGGSAWGETLRDLNSPSGKKYIVSEVQSMMENGTYGGLHLDNVDRIKDPNKLKEIIDLVDKTSGGKMFVVPKNNPETFAKMFKENPDMNRAPYAWMENVRKGMDDKSVTDFTKSFANPTYGVEFGKTVTPSQAVSKAESEHTAKTRGLAGVYHMQDEKGVGFTSRGADYYPGGSESATGNVMPPVQQVAPKLSNPKISSPISGTASIPGVMVDNSTARAPATGAILKMTNQNATRNMQLNPKLSSKIQEAVAAVYGDGYTAEVYSGGQPGIGSGGARVGSTRHDHGKASDTYIVGPDGKRVTGSKLDKLGQYWVAKGYGGVGLQMAGGGIHLDMHSDRDSKTWNYDGGNASRSAMMAKGLRGELPELAPQRPAGVNPSKLPAIRVANEAQQFEARRNAIMDSPLLKTMKKTETPIDGTMVDKAPVQVQPTENPNTEAYKAMFKEEDKPVEQITTGKETMVDPNTLAQRDGHVLEASSNGPQNVAQASFEKEKVESGEKNPANEMGETSHDPEVASSTPGSGGYGGPAARSSGGSNTPDGPTICNI